MSIMVGGWKQPREIEASPRPDSAKNPNGMLLFGRKKCLRPIERAEGKLCVFNAHDFASTKCVLAGAQYMNSRDAAYEKREKWTAERIAGRYPSVSPGFNT